MQQVFEIQKDTLGSANWVIGSRIADKSCILTMGVNFGVHAASCELGVIPDVFCCDVDIPGKSDLKTHLEQTQAYHASMLKMAYRFRRDRRTSESRKFLESIVFCKEYKFP